MPDAPKPETVPPPLPLDVAASARNPAEPSERDPAKADLDAAVERGYRPI